MENSPNTNTPPSKELAVIPVNYPEFATEAPTSTRISQDQWEQIYTWVVGDPATGKGGIPRVGELSLQRKFGLDETTAMAVFEEMQARDIVSKESVPTPGKGAVRLDGYDQTRFGGHMVLINPDSSSKQPIVHDPLPEEPQFKAAPDFKGIAPDLYRHHAKRSVVRTMLRGTVSTTQAIADYAYLKGYHAADSADYLSGKRGERDHDAEAHKIDRAYNEIFTSNATVPFERTVPPLEIVPDTDPRSQLEREVDAEIEALRARGTSDADIKTELLKRYHPDREDGGSEEKVRLVTNKLMKHREPLAEAVRMPKPDIDLIIQESKANTERALSKEASEEAYKQGITYLAGGIGKTGKDFTRMSQESFTNALLSRGVAEDEARDLYAEFQDKGYIAKTPVPGEGYRVLKSREEFEAILKAITT